MKKVFLITAVSLLLFTTPKFLYPQTTEPDTQAYIINSLDAEKIIDQNKPALVSIWYFTNEFYSYTKGLIVDTNILNGSGFIIHEDGIVVTNNHVIENLDSILVKTSDGRFFNANVLITQPENDLAILRINDAGDRKFPIVLLGNSDSVRSGQRVFSIGSPLGFEYTISEGIIAAIREQERVEFMDPLTYTPMERVFDKVIQITAPISPGNSGGVLMNERGRVIGITTYSYGFYGNLNFAIAINSLRNLIEGIDFNEIESNIELLAKQEESVFANSLRIADQLKLKLYYNWYYSKQLDTMTVVDTFTVKQDSVNKINFTKAEDLYSKCIEINPDTFYVYQQLMDLYVFTENFPKAENLYLSIKDIFTSDSLLNTLSASLASAYSTSKNYDKAILFYRKMLAEEPDNVYTKYQIANMLQESGNTSEAISEYNSIISNNPEYVLALVQLGKIYYDRKNYKEAGKFFEQAYEKELMNYSYYSSVPDLYFYRGMLAVRNGKKFDAILAYLELKSLYTYAEEDKKRKFELYKAIADMDE